MNKKRRNFLKLSGITATLIGSNTDLFANEENSSFKKDEKRLLYPMKRNGVRGTGKWERVSWEAATEEIAQNIFDVMTDLSRGAKKLMVHSGNSQLSKSYSLASERFCAQLGAIKFHPKSYTSDMFSGAVVAYGDGNIGCSDDFLYGANTAIMWGVEPSLSNAIWKSRHDNVKVIVITSEFSASATSADLWVPIKHGSDSTLAMSIMHVILKEKLHKPEFMKLFTDLTFLVDVETKKMISPSQISESTDKDEFYAWNTKTNSAVLMPGTKGSEHKTLRLKEFGISPALEGTFEIKDVNGRTIEVTPVYELLKQSIAKFAPEVTQTITGVSPKVVKALARDIATPKVVEITTGSSLSRYFNGLMTIWNIASICGLTGRMGPYGGLNTKNEFTTSGVEAISGFDGKYNPRVSSGFIDKYLFSSESKKFDKYFTDEDVKRAQNAMSKFEHMQIVDAMLKDGEYGKSTRVKPWFEPDTAIVSEDKNFNKDLIDKTKFFAYIGSSINEVANKADILLPAYSKDEVYDISLPHNSNRAAKLTRRDSNIKNLDQVKDQWSIFTLIAKKLEEISNKTENIDKAKAKDDTKYARNGYHNLASFHKEYTNTDNSSILNSEPHLANDRLALEAVLKECDQFKPWTIEKMIMSGGFLQINEKAGKSSPLYSDRPYSSFENTLYKFEPMNTLSGRQTFYVDHSQYIRLGANTNTSMRDIHPEDKKYPFTMIAQGTKDEGALAYIQISSQTAKMKDLKSSDKVRIYNKLGEFHAIVKISHLIRPQTVILEALHNRLTPQTLNLLEMADGWGHLKFGTSWDGNRHEYNSKINFEKINEVIDE